MNTTCLADMDLLYFQHGSDAEETAELSLLRETVESEAEGWQVQV